MDENGYYDSDDIWSELSSSEKIERLVDAGFGFVMNTEQIWNECSKETKKRILSSPECPPGFTDLNKANLDDLVSKLKTDIMFRSDSEAHVIGKLIEYYEKHRRRHFSKKPKI